MTVLNTILTIVFIILSIVITVIILMQEGKSAGLGAIAGAADTYWGKNKGRSMEGMLVKLTRIFVILFLVIASNIAYNIICETVYLIFLIAVALTKSIFPLQSLKYVSAICIFVILHILLVLLESVAQMYLTFWDKK